MSDVIPPKPPRVVSQPEQKQGVFSWLLHKLRLKEHDPLASYFHFHPRKNFDYEDDVPTTAKHFSYQITEQEAPFERKATTLMHIVPPEMEQKAQTRIIADVDPKEFLQEATYTQQQSRQSDFLREAPTIIAKKNLAAVRTFSHEHEEEQQSIFSEWSTHGEHQEGHRQSDFIKEVEDGS